MESDKMNKSYQKNDRDTEYGEPGFVFTEYDRGARSENSNKNEEPSSESDENQQN